MARSWLSTVVALLASAQLGCSWISVVEAGGAYAIGRQPESAAQVEGTLGSGATQEHGGEGVALTARAKGGPHVVQGALGVSTYVLAGPRWVHERTDKGRVIEAGTGPPSFAFFALAGTTLVQVESLYGRFAAGTLGPSGKLGVFLRAPGKSWGFTFSLGGEYDRRWTDTPDTGYAVFAIGFGEVHYGRGDTLIIGPD
jgi:hypothetical protein